MSSITDSTHFDNIVKKINDLRRLSTSANENEAKTAAAMAEKLIARYRITNEMINAGLPKEDSFTADGEFIYESARVTMWKVQLIGMLCRHYGCVYVNRAVTINNRKNSRYSLFGRPEDMKIIKDMYSWLESTITFLTHSNARGKGHTYCHSYSLGMVHGIMDQITASAKAVADSMKSEDSSDQLTTALAMVSDRSSQAMDHLLKADKRIRKATVTSHAKHNYDGFSSGKVAGQNLHLGKSLTSIAIIKN